MPSTTRRVAVIAIASVFSLMSLSGDVLAKSARSKSRAAPAAIAILQSSGAGSYYNPSSSGNIYAPRPVSRGNVIYNTAGWGDVGAR